jgi:uncharacterized protein
MTPNNSAAIKPWYRQPWPWILMAGPFAVVVAGIVTVYLAVVSNDGLVEDDYYKQGLAVNQMAVRDQKAVALGVQADLMQSGDGTHVRVLLSGNHGTVLPREIRLRMIHPTRSGVDQKIVLRAESAGVYAAKLTAPLEGRWHVVLEDDKSEWRVTGDWVVEKNQSLHLPVMAK